MVATAQPVAGVSERLSLKMVEREKEPSHLTISHSGSMRVSLSEVYKIPIQELAIYSVKRDW